MRRVKRYTKRVSRQNDHQNVITTNHFTSGISGLATTQIGNKTDHIKLVENMYIQRDGSLVSRDPILPLPINGTIFIKEVGSTLIKYYKSSLVQLKDNPHIWISHKPYVAPSQGTPIAGKTKDFYLEYYNSENEKTIIALEEDMSDEDNDFNKQSISIAYNSHFDVEYLKGNKWIWKLNFNEDNELQYKKLDREIVRSEDLDTLGQNLYGLEKSSDAAYISNIVPEQNVLKVTNYIPYKTNNIGDYITFNKNTLVGVSNVFVKTQQPVIYLPEIEVSQNLVEHEFENIWKKFIGKNTFGDILKPATAVKDTVPRASIFFQLNSKAQTENFYILPLLMFVCEDPTLNQTLHSFLLKLFSNNSANLNKLYDVMKKELDWKYVAGFKHDATPQTGVITLSILFDKAYAVVAPKPFSIRSDLAKSVPNISLLWNGVDMTSEFQRNGLTDTNTSVAIRSTGYLQNEGRDHLTEHAALRHLPIAGIVPYANFNPDCPWGTYNKLTIKFKDIVDHRGIRGMTIVTNKNNLRKDIPTSYYSPGKTAEVYWPISQNTVRLHAYEVAQTDFTKKSFKKTQKYSEVFLSPGASDTHSRLTNWSHTSKKRGEPLVETVEVRDTQFRMIMINGSRTGRTDREVSPSYIDGQKKWIYTDALPFGYSDRRAHLGLLYRDAKNARLFSRLIKPSGFMGVLKIDVNWRDKSNKLIAYKSRYLPNDDLDFKVKWYGEGSKTVYTASDTGETVGKLHRAAYNLQPITHNNFSESDLIYTEFIPKNADKTWDDNKIKYIDSIDIYIGQGHPYSTPKINSSTGTFESNIWDQAKKDFNDWEFLKVFSSFYDIQFLTHSSFSVHGTNVVPKVVPVTSSIVHIIEGDLTDSLVDSFIWKVNEADKLLVINKRIGLFGYKNSKIDFFNRPFNYIAMSDVSRPGYFPVNLALDAEITRGQSINNATKWGDKLFISTPSTLSLAYNINSTNAQVTQLHGSFGIPNEDISTIKSMGRFLMFKSGYSVYAFTPTKATDKSLALIPIGKPIESILENYINKGGYKYYSIANSSIYYLILVGNNETVIFSYDSDPTKRYWLKHSIKKAFYHFTSTGISHGFTGVDVDGILYQFFVKNPKVFLSKFDNNNWKIIHDKINADDKLSNIDLIIQKDKVNLHGAVSDEGFKIEPIMGYIDLGYRKPVLNKIKLNKIALLVGTVKKSSISSYSIMVGINGASYRDSFASLKDNKIPSASLLADPFNFTENSPNNPLNDITNTFQPSIDFLYKPDLTKTTHRLDLMGDTYRVVVQFKMFNKIFLRGVSIYYLHLAKE